MNPRREHAELVLDAGLEFLRRELAIVSIVAFRDFVVERRTMGEHDARVPSEHVAGGPQRDEIEFSVDGRPARQCASQGQQRLITLALKFAELECVRAARGAHPVLLLDDVSSELDPERTRAVAEWLHASESQVFVTTTRRDLFRGSGVEAPDRADFSLVSGTLEKAD